MTVVVLATVAGTTGLVALGWWWWRVPMRSPRGAGRGSVRLGSRRTAGAAAAGLLGAIVTRWPVGALLFAAAAWGLPGLWSQRSVRSAIERHEAIASWTEMLRDTLHASAGLSQAIVTTAPLAAAAIRPAVGGLAARLASGVPLDQALRSLAHEVADPAADTVVCALLLAASARAQRLGDVLGALATSTRHEVAMRRRVEAMRASARSSVRLVAGSSVAFFAVLAVAAHGYLAPFGNPAGQAILAAVGCCDGAGLWLMARMTRDRPAPRLLGFTGEPSP